jgi:glycosyltransferase involved in cell wall biosynthesis
VNEGVSPEKIAVIYNGLDPERFRCDASQGSMREKYGFSVDAKIVGIVARLHPMKDHRTFFDALKIAKLSLPTIQAAVVGDGASREELEHYVAELGIAESVHFLGAVGDVLPELLRIMDVFLFTSRWGESLPNALLEAMAAGIPIVATRMHGVPEIVTDRLNGFLVDIGDRQLMAERLVRLLSEDDLRQQFVEHGTRTLKRFTIRRMVSEYELLYGSLT